MKILSRPLCCLENGSKIFESLKRTLQPLLPIDTIVLGLPLYLNGKESPMSEEVRKFAEQLKLALALPVVLWDERLTSAQADRALRDAEVKRKKRAQLEDTLAAAMILQSYLDYRPYSNEK